MDRIDLHTHSTVSDGSMTPAELIRHAKETGLRAIALTDHDTAAGLPEARAAAAKEGIEFINGVELACLMEKTELHIVGLFIDDTDPAFSEAMTEMQAIRDERNLRMIRLMQEAGVDITPEKLRETEGSGVLTRANFAGYLMKTGFVSSISEAFDRWLGDGKPFYLRRQYITPAYAVSLIKKAGGIPILAHPLIYKIGKETLEKYVAALTECGLEGMEILYGTNSESDDIYSRQLADRFHLKYSGGSDFHGSYKPHIRLGCGKGRMVIPYDILEQLKR